MIQSTSLSGRLQPLGRPLARLSLAALAFLIAGSVCELAAAPPLRSTEFDGSTWLQFSDHDVFRPQGGFTIETWVYREDSNRCETVISKDFTSSWWLGFCSVPRFYHGNGQFVDATRGVPSRQWCHLAVTHDGENIRFYIDGEDAGSHESIPSLQLNDDPVTIGADVGGGFPLRGRLDELRIWHRPLDASEIRDRMFREVRTGDDLRAVFGDGGKTELLVPLVATEFGKPACDAFGILPRELSVPHSSGTPVLDGLISPAEYAGSEMMVLRYHDGEIFRDALARLVHDGTDLYVGVEFLTLPVPPKDPDSRPGITLLFDPDLEPNGHPTEDELAVGVGLDEVSPAVRFIGDGEFSYNRCEDVDDCPEPGLFDGVIGPSCETADFAPCAEFRISRSLLGADDARLGLALYNYRYHENPAEARIAPGDASIENPTTWAFAHLEDGIDPPGGDGNCQVPFEIPSSGPFPFTRADVIDEPDGTVDSIPCLPLPTPGAEAVYEFTPSQSGRYRIAAYSTDGANLALALGSNCPLDEDSCRKGSDESGAGAPEVIVVDLEAGTSNTIIVDSSGETPPGEVQLHVDLLVDDSLLIARAQARDENEYEVIRNVFPRVWHVIPDEGVVVGEVEPRDAATLSKNGAGVAVFQSPETIEIYQPRPSLRFAEFFHDPALVDEIEIHYLEPGAPLTGTIQAYVATESGGDFEEVTLSPEGDRWVGRLGLVLAQQQGDPGDGDLQVNPGEILIGLHRDPDAAQGEEPLMAISVVRGRQGMNRVAIDFDPEVPVPVTQTPGTGQEPPRPVGGVIDENEQVIALGSDQLVVDDRFGDVDRLVARLNATVIDAGPDDGQIPNPYRLLRFDPDEVDLRDATILLELAGAQGTIRVSDEATLAMLVVSIEERLRGSNVTPNFLIELHERPRLSNRENNVFNEPEGHNEIQGAQRAWMLTSALDIDTRSVRVGVIDSDFCDRLPEEVNVVGGFNHHAISSNPYGITGPPGTRKYHGTKMATVVGGRMGNGLGSGGSGGQVADLLLYNVGGLTYYYEAAAGTLAATADGARVINMSFGFPCSLAGINLCQLGGGPFICLVLGPIIDAALLLAQPFLPFPVPPVGACFVILGYLEGMNAALTGAIAVAQAADIVVVASAGNPLSGMDPAPIEPFHIIPAMTPGVFSVGATSSDLENTMMFGLTIDAWVIERNRSWSPLSSSENCEGFVEQGVGGTSAAAAYVSGLVAQMRAANPSLSSPAIQAILRRNTVRSPRPGRDPRVLRFLRSHLALMEAALPPLGSFPDPRPLFPSLGFDESPRSNWLASSASGWATAKSSDADTAGTAIPIPFADARSGASIADAGLSHFTRDWTLDRDYYRILSDGAGPTCQSYSVTVAIEYLTGAGDVRVIETPVLGTESRTTLGGLGLTRYVYTARHVFFDRDFVFRVGGDDNFYRMTVQVNEEGPITADRFEPNEDETEATPIAESDFSTFNAGFWWEHRLLLENLSFDCSDDVDTFLVDFPPLNEDCTDIQGACGQDFSAGRLTRLRFTGEGIGLIEVYHPDVVDPEPSDAIASGAGTVEIECPASDLGLDRVLVKLYPVESMRMRTTYDLSVRYSAPLVRPDLNPRNFLCCEHPLGCDAPDLEIDPSVFDVEPWSPADPDRHPSEYDLVCPPGVCEFPPSQYWQIDWLGGEFTIGLGLDFTLPVSTAFEGVLLDLDHQVVARFEDVNGERTHWELQTGTLPADYYYVRLRGVEYRSVYRIYNLDPLPVTQPGESSLTPRVISSSSCGATSTISIELQADTPVSGASLGLTWDPDLVELVDVVPGPGVPEDDILTFILQRNREAFGEAVIGLVMESGNTLDATVPLDAFRARFRIHPGHNGPVNATVCTATDVGEPSVSAVVSVFENDQNRSTTPDLGCVEFSVSPDVEAPDIVCPDDFTVAGGPNGALVEWTVTALDSCGEVTVVCEPESGSFFPPGVTTVICEATDESGNVSECSFEVTVQDQPDFRRGDANGDVLVDITDPITILSNLFLGTAVLSCPDAADANDDQQVDITDPITVLSYLFLGTVTIPPPGTAECGQDPTPDDLELCVYTADC